MDRQKVTTPHDNDIIKGRGNGANLHPGNIHFRQLVKVAREGYALSSKADKKKYAESILQHISSLDPPGRFLDKDDKGQWFVMDAKKSKAKTRQALREGVPAIVKAHNQQQMLEEEPEPLFLDLHVAACATSSNNSIIDYRNGMADTADRMTSLRSLNDPSSSASSKASKSISHSSAVTNQALTRHDLHEAESGDRSGTGKCEDGAESISDSSGAADFGCDELDESDEQDEERTAKDGRK